LRAILKTIISRRRRRGAKVVVREESLIDLRISSLREDLIGQLTGLMFYQEARLANRILINKISNH